MRISLDMVLVILAKKDIIKYKITYSPFRVHWIINKVMRFLSEKKVMRFLIG